jgi:hypothetical protein
MGSIRKMKREKVNPFPVPNLKAAYEMGYAEGKIAGINEGAFEQRKLDIQSVANVLNDLEGLPGIGKATANKIRYLVASKMQDRLEGEIEP